MKRDIVEKLEFGCPFKHGTIGEKDAELAEVLMQEGANEIKRMRDNIREMRELLKESMQFCQRTDGDGDSLNIHLARKINMVLVESV